MLHLDNPIYEKVFMLELSQKGVCNVSRLCTAGRCYLDDDNKDAKMAQYIKHAWLGIFNSQNNELLRDLMQATIKRDKRRTYDETPIFCRSPVLCSEDSDHDPDLSKHEASIRYRGERSSACKIA